MTIASAIATFESDVAITHQIVHSTADTVTTEHGPLRTFFKLEQDAMDAVLAMLPNIDMKEDKASLSLYRTNKDTNGIYTTITYRRQDNSLARTSVLSGGTSPTYTTRTAIFYKPDGITVELTQVFTLTYVDDEFASEALQ